MSSKNKSTHAILAEAIGTGELINIIYHGGSEPGTARFVLPLKLDENKLRARCYKTDAVKIYDLSKIALAEGDNRNFTGQFKRADPDRIEGISSVDDIALCYKSELENLGWIVAYDNDFFGIFKQYKNGKRYKRPSAEIRRVYDDFPGRPWLCLDKRFKFVSIAAKALLEFARSNAQNLTKS